jgi:4-amino-4-deoxy-L-arabinose transferase-like glycosyltransferase
VLALGVLAGVPWLVNPTIAGLTIILAHALLSRLYDRGFAHVAVLLLATSPWFLFMSASFMTHPITLVWSLIAFLAIEKARQKNPGRWGAIAGASLGALFLTRPLEGIIIAAVLGAWTLGTWKSPRALRTLGAGGVAAILVGGLSLPYNAMTTGKVTYFPMARYFDDHWYSGANRLGFGPDIGNVGWEHIDPFPGHGILDVIVNTHQNLYLLNFESFGWSFGSIPFVLLLLLWRQWNRADWLSLIIVLATITGNSFYFFSGAPDFGARYWYQVLIPLGVLTVRGIQELQRRCASTEQTPLAGPRVGAFVVLASLVALINFLPWRSLGKYNHYRGVRSDIMRLAQEYNFGHSLVFVREEDKSDYPSTFIFNPPNLNSTGTIYVRDIGPAGRAAVAQNFPDRPHWIVAGSSVLGGPFTLVSGPLPALAAQAR